MSGGRQNMYGGSGRISRLSGLIVVIVAANCLTGCRASGAKHHTRWHESHSDVTNVPAIVFHCDHGMLAGSYPDGVETVAVEFDDVCAQLGHVCLCGAGGFRIAREVTETLRSDGPLLERESFILISGRDHTVSDVIAFVLGSTRRANPEYNQYFIDDSIVAPRREYHYYIGYVPARTAVHVVYRKHLLIGHDEMDELWKIELAFDQDPDSVRAEDVDRYRRAMRGMVRDVLFDQVPGLILVEPVSYDDFQRRLDRLKP